MPGFMDLTGRKMGDWRVLSRAPDRQTPSMPITMYRARCVCGRECDVIAQSLRSGASRRCIYCRRLKEAQKRLARIEKDMAAVRLRLEAIKRKASLAAQRRAA